MDFYLSGFNRTTLEKKAARDCGRDEYRGGWRENEKGKKRESRVKCFLSTKLITEHYLKTLTLPLHWQCIISSFTILKVTTTSNSPLSYIFQILFIYRCLTVQWFSVKNDKRSKHKPCRAKYLKLEFSVSVFYTKQENVFGLHWQQTVWKCWKNVNTQSGTRTNEALSACVKTRL